MALSQARQAAGAHAEASRLHAPMSLTEAPTMRPELTSKHGNDCARTSGLQLDRPRSNESCRQRLVTDCATCERSARDRMRDGDG
jgi:hypothetical protein